MIYFDGKRPENWIFEFKMIAILYRWRVKPEREAQFIEAWSEITAYYRENFGSLGSRLHRGGDGLFYAYAQWRSAADREKAFADATRLAAGLEMKESIEESFDEILLEVCSDYLILPDPE